MIKRIIILYFDFREIVALPSLMLRSEKHQPASKREPSPRRPEIKRASKAPAFTSIWTRTVNYLKSGSQQLAELSSYYLVRFSPYIWIYCVIIRGVYRNCTTTSHKHFAERIGESFKRVYAASFRPYPYQAPIFYWSVKRESQRCLIVGLLWGPLPSTQNNEPIKTDYCHWFFYADGTLKHSCVLGADNSHDKHTIIAYAEQEDRLDDASRSALDLITNDPNCLVGHALTNEICQVLKDTMLKNATFANTIDHTLFEPHISIIHRTFLYSDTVNWSQVFSWGA